MSIYPAIFSGVYCYMKLQGCIRLVNVTRINYIMILLSLLTEASTAIYDYASLYVTVYPAIFSGVYCYMKLQGYVRLVNVTGYNYTMDYLTLLLCPVMPFYGYARQYISVCSAMTVEFTVMQHYCFIKI